ncbi:hypothetical protein NA57DRAFT_72206 [Rhizodiscina lignyota]|uniref:Cyclochlorotine biosynthesis protein O n=1 Tax=Rhizodiscina lignyota TaxID=1504668 RepID=A0A9P4MD89_9PEZI|nr:hypothetical protein NA57DRAFT_72206 [Rhizodiscina lignyota]
MEKDLESYAPLRRGSASLSDEHLDATIYQRQPKRREWLWRGSALFLLVTVNIMVLFIIFHFNKRMAPANNEPEPPEFGYAPIEELPTVYRRFDWWTAYSSDNTTESEKSWDDINPAHGFIAMDKQWAKEHNWPDSMYPPDDRNKKVYLLEAYHLLHCLTVTRKTFWQAVNGEELYWRPPHVAHCLDMLRQYIVCKADNTPLFTFGDNTAGDEQYRKCKSWDALRDYATENSACYRDVPKGVDRDNFSLGEHFGYCDGGYDGVIVEADRRGNWEHGALHRIDEVA